MTPLWEGSKTCYKVMRKEEKTVVVGCSNNDVKHVNHISIGYIVLFGLLGPFPAPKYNIKKKPVWQIQPFKRRYIKCG